ncbi:MAG: 50S ribosomal protein L6, partial [Gammaproteobacteria bacterium]|nr:50S ribosomal protein L6 [Gammaproteobacteria bacterium]
MSRVAKNPVVIPKNVEVNISDHDIKIKGPKGTLLKRIEKSVEVAKKDSTIVFKTKEGEDGNADATAGTMRALVKNMVDGVTKGFEKKLILIGVGFK